MIKPTLIFSFFSLMLFSCDHSTSKTNSPSGQVNETNKKIIKTIDYSQFSPITDFDKCMEVSTYQLFAAAEKTLDAFILENLSEDKNLKEGYRRYCLVWMGETATMDTDELLGGNIARQLYHHPSFSQIWSRATALGDTVYTEELVFENGKEKIIEYIDDYWTFNPNSAYYTCLKTIRNPFVGKYINTKNLVGDVEPTTFALEAYEDFDRASEDFDVFKKLIISELYLRLIALRIAYREGM